jgi:O-antigen/teichoic acid export membrane protein
MKRLIRALRTAIGKMRDGESNILTRNSPWIFVANLNSSGRDFIGLIILGGGLDVENSGIYILN